MRIAVVGGGIFGVTIALQLDAEGYSVDLFEARPDILRAASGINQFRLHRGYHYPRSDKTVKQLMKSEPKFRELYPDVVMKGSHFYAIAKEGSLTEPDAYLDFCDGIGLQYAFVTPAWVDPRKLAFCIEVSEESIDPDALHSVCWRRLRRSHVAVHLDTWKSLASLDHDLVVVATYAGLNRFLTEPERECYQYELCEKVIMELPRAAGSLVVMDGPFGCIDPYGTTGQFLLGHVEHAVHARSVGKHTEVPLVYHDLMDAPPRRRLAFSKAQAIINALSEYVPALTYGDYVGSMYTVRTVRPGVEETDERPSVVRKVNDRVITAFGGKIPDCVVAAEKVSELVRAS